MSDEYLVAVDATILVKVVNHEVLGAEIVAGEDMPDASRINGDDIDSNAWNEKPYYTAARAAVKHIEANPHLSGTAKLD